MQAAPNETEAQNSRPTKTAMDASVAAPEAQFIDGWSFVAIGVAIVLSMFLVRFLGPGLSIFTACCVHSVFQLTLPPTIISTAIPRITDEFHSLNDVGWYASALFLAVAAAQSVWGKAFKCFPIKSVYLISIAVFEIGSLICGVAQNSTTLIAGRAITGFGVAGTFGGSYVIIGISAPPKQRPAMTGFMGSAYAIASIIGPLVGGALTDKASWRWCFYINLPCGAVAAAAIVLFFHPPKTVKSTEVSLKEKLLQMNIPGFLIVVAAVVCYLLALQWGGVSESWGSANVVGTLVGAFALFLVFLVDEWYQGNRALILPKLIKNRTIAHGCAFSFFIAGAFYIMLYYLPLYFQSIQGQDAMQSGIRTLPLILGLTLTQIATGISVGATKLFNPFIVLGSILSTVACGLLMTLEVDSPPRIWIGYQALAGIGLGLCFNVYIIIIQNIVDPEDVATATGMLLFFQSLGGALVVSAAQSLFQNEIISTLEQTIPALNPGQVFQVGASQIQTSFSGAVLTGIDASYMRGIHMAFALAIAMAGASALVALGQEWFRLQVPAEMQRPGNASEKHQAAEDVEKGS